MICARHLVKWQLPKYVTRAARSLDGNFGPTTEGEASRMGMHQTKITQKSLPKLPLFLYIQLTKDEEMPSYKVFVSRANNALINVAN